MFAYRPPKPRVPPYQRHRDARKRKGGLSVCLLWPISSTTTALMCLRFLEVIRCKLAQSDHCVTSTRRDSESLG